jgi:excisionase family DNA binding protein
MDILDSKNERASILRPEDIAEYLRVHPSTMMTLENVAEYLRVHPSTIYRLLKSKQLPGFKIGRDWRFNRESIDRWRADAERRGHLNYSAQ